MWVCCIMVGDVYYMEGFWYGRHIGDLHSLTAIRLSRGCGEDPFNQDCCRPARSFGITEAGRGQ
jgi:hypothetical protein